MDNTLEFEFDDGGKMYLEMSSEGELLIRLQAQHPGSSWKVTSISVALDNTKVTTIKEWLK